VVSEFCWERQGPVLLYSFIILISDRRTVQSAEMENTKLVIGALVGTLIFAAGLYFAQG
jgi:hypothetical protein